MSPGAAEVAREAIGRTHTRVTAETADVAAVVALQRPDQERHTDHQDKNRTHGRNSSLN